MTSAFNGFVKSMYQTSDCITLQNRPLTLSLLLTTQETFVDSADRDQTTQKLQSDL